MKSKLITPLLITTLFLLPTGAFATNNMEKTVGNTLVRVEAQGADTEWVSNADIAQAEELTDFANTYNKIIAKGNLSAEQVRNELATAAKEALSQQANEADCLHEISFAPVYGSDNPELKMIVYPHTSFGYRFEVSFTPQS